MYAYKIGERVEAFADGVDGAQFDMTDGGGILLIKFNSPTSKEVDQIKNGKIRYSISYLNNVIYILWKFGSLEYLETPYSFSASKNLTELQEPIDSSGYAVNMILADSSDGEIKAIKLLSLSNRASKKLLDLISKQPYMELGEYYVNVLNTQSKYTTKDILNYSLVTGKIG